ncbi:MAG: histidinol dehydrogenase [halophilic archaeon J07HX5]|jgi:histidinol dehydrogenase (EC 1.1.1.23)|nr:MAG: histidinol dehydrogenase [halophilic archaeon J07HX5]
MNPQRTDELSPAEQQGLFERDSGIESARAGAAEIVERVRTDGDAALRALADELDGVQTDTVEITDQAARAVETIDPAVRSAIETAAGNIRAFHERQRPEDWRETFDGRELGRRFRALDSAGVYAPGGTAAYPSSALMGVIPATVAGVDHVAVATPPAETVSPATLAAAEIAGADAVYQVGGAQAIGALAYGTETVTPCDVVVGPGNRWVAAAKAVVRGDVEIDFLAGPSEVVVLADASADPELVAAELLAQAEHDTRAAVAAVTDDPELAAAVSRAVDRQLGERERETIIREALASDASGLFVAPSLAAAAAFANRYAPEHLGIIAENDEALLDQIDSAGSAFLGPHSPVAAGDYASGPNHVLPTGGGPRRVGGLSVETFLRSMTVQRLDREALGELADSVTTLAETEGLEAHAASVRQRFD